MTHRDDRSPEAETYRVLYRDKRWRGPHGVRTRQLAEHPLCVMCQKQGRVTVATVCDHVDPKSKASEATFFKGPFQSLCDDPRYRCHSSRKQQQEIRGYSTEVDASGLPTDPAHPFNRG